MRADKTIKTLLGFIAVLLAVIAFRPILDVATPAHAQAGSSTSKTSTDAAPLTGPYKTELVNRVVFREPVLGVQVMDGIDVFLVQTKNSVEVYRVTH